MITITYSTKVDICFDSIFTMTMSGSIDEIIAKIKEMFEVYGFTTADAIDVYTGEIVITAID